MALILQFNICQKQNCKEIIFTETTGAYSNPGNLTGWGVTGSDTDPQINTATLAVLTVTIPSGDEYEFDLLTEGFPSVYNSTEFVITNDMIGGTTNTVIPDGIYTFVYSVFSDQTNETYTQTRISTLICNVTCCVNSMFKDIDFSCDCSEEQQDKAIDAWILLKGLQSNCGDPAKFNTNLETLQRLCINSSCNNCR